MKTATDKRTETSLDKGLLKVLLVEDEATDRISVERILRTCSSPVGFVVESVVTLSEAIRNLAEKKYDAILLDLSLPDSSGIETVRQTVKAAPDIPVVVLNELEDEQTGFLALEDGAIDYLVKDLPLDVVLVRTIVYALQRKKIQMQSLKLTHDINERMKELNCLYGISKLVETPGISLEEILEKMVCLIPAGWQYPGIACARIVFEGREYKTDNFKPSKWTQSADITHQGQKVGTVEVCYMKERPQSDEGPFLGEERDLIDAIGERLGKIAERIKAEEALLKSEEFTRRLIDSSNDCIKVLDLDGHLLSMSRGGQKLLEIDDITPYLNRSWIDFWKGKDREAALDTISKAKKGEAGTFYGYCETAKGMPKWWEVSISPIKDPHGNIDCLLSISRDITDRKQAENALRESEERYKNLFKANIDGILIADATTKKFRYANPAICRMLGYSEEEFMQMGVADIHPKESLEQVNADFEAQTSGAKITADLQCVRKGGQVISVSINAGTVMIDQTKYLMGIFRDVTAQRQEQEKLLAYQKQLRDFASEVSLTEERERKRLAIELHDHVTQNLILFKINLSELCGKALPGKLIGSLNEIYKHLDQIIGDIRSFTFDLCPPTLYELGLEPAVRECLIEEIQQKHGIKTELECDDQPKPLENDVCVLLYRAVHELLINVVKHAQAKHVKVSISRDDDNVKVCVEDDGTGFSPPPNDSGYGHRAGGFGLFSIRERLSCFGGTVAIDSERGHGTCVTLFMPINMNKGTKDGYKSFAGR